VNWVTTTNNAPKNPEKPLKVVVIGSFNPNKPAYHPAPNEDQYYLASWAGQWARRVKERYPDLDIEVWRPEPDFSDISYRKAFGTVDCTIFPAKGFIVSKTLTRAMLKQLWRYKKNYHLVFHINTIFDWQFNIMMPLFFPGARIVLSHHGGVFPTGPGIKWAIKRKVLKFSFRNIDSVTYLRKAVRDLIQKTNSKTKLTFLPVGANFDHFTPLDKVACRKKLNLPLDKVLAVYVGKFYRLKGVDHILEAYQHFKDKNFSVIFVGGGRHDELYESVVKSGCPYWGHVDHDLLRKIYSAANFYIHPAFHPDFGGIDVVWMEALASNRPVLSPMLKELDFDYSELGLLMECEKDLIPKTTQMIETFGLFSNCREAAIQHLDSNTSIIDKLYGIYTEK
jgi:glycosyltransferase involved in cell wall biosynthesis